MKHYFLIVLFSFFISLQSHFLHAAHGWAGQEEPLAKNAPFEALSPECQSMFRKEYGIPEGKSIEEAAQEKRKAINTKKALAAKNPCTLDESQKKLILKWFNTLKKVKPRYHAVVRETFACLIKILFGINTSVILNSRMDYADDFLYTELHAVTFVRLEDIRLEQFSPEQAGLILYFKSLINNATSSIDNASPYDIMNIGPFDQNINQLLDFLATYGTQPENESLKLYFKFITGSIMVKIIDKEKKLNNAYDPDFIQIVNFWTGISNNQEVPEELRDAVVGLCKYFSQFGICSAYPQGSSQVFDCDNPYHRCFLREWYKDFYVQLYNAIDNIDKQKKGIKNKPLLIEVEGTQLNIPHSLDGSLTPYDPEAPQTGSTAINDEWSLEETLKALGEQPSSSKKKPKQKAAAPKQMDETQAAAAATTQARVPQKGSSDLQASAVVLPPAFVHKNIHPSYTQTAKLWAENPERAIEQYGYLNPTPKDENQKLHRRIFKEMEKRYGENAEKMLVANHTVPTIVDEYMLDFEPTQYHHDWLVTAPLYRVNADGTTDEGIYEVLYKKNKKKLTIYHKLFRPMAHQDFVATAFSEGETKPFTADEVPSANDWENVWHPVSGEWNVEIKPPYYLEFSRPETQESYYLLKHPLIMPATQD